MNRYGELKPCPFCGGHAEIKKMYDYDRLIYVICTKCSSQSAVFPTREAAVKRWNTRYEATTDEKAESEA